MIARWKLPRPVNGAVLYLRRISVAVAALFVAISWTMAPTAAAQAGNQITGTVYDSSTLAPIPGILVAAYTSVDAVVNNDQPVAKTNTEQNGTYALQDLPDGSYLIQFNSLLDEANYNSNYYEQYYNGISTIRGDQQPAVTMVTVNGGQVVAGINAHLTPLVPTTTVLTSSNNPSATGQTITLTAKVTPSNTSGMMIYTDNGQLIPGCGFTLFSNGVATCTVALNTGTHNITAFYNGDPTYKPSNTATLTQTVVNAPYKYSQCLYGGWRNFTQPKFWSQTQCLVYVFWHYLGQ